MWICPICKQSCQTNFCAECGYDHSRDYEQFPTLQSIPSNISSIPARRAEYENAHVISTCLCCGSNLTNGQCSYCGFVPLNRATPEQNHRRVVQHALGIVSALTDFSIKAYRYVWVPERSRLECQSPKVIQLGNAQEFFNSILWTQHQFAQYRNSNGTELNLTLTYKYRDKRKLLHCASPTVKTEGFWKLGISLDLSFRLQLHLGTDDKIVSSAPITLDLT